PPECMKLWPACILVEAARMSALGLLQGVSKVKPSGTSVAIQDHELNLSDVPSNIYYV
ncbi:MAG: hypothetical protein EZS28_040296, partial [Streblomastix strix]